MTELVIDCTELYNNPVRTGIQRVVRKLLSHWPHNRVRARVARFDPVRGLVPIPERAIDLLKDKEHGVATMSVDDLIRALQSVPEEAEPLPSHARAFIPEVFYNHARCEFYRGRDPAMLAYDFLPWLRPELFASTSVAGLMPYLRLLRTVRDVAFISPHTMREYETRIARRPANGPVLPLGADGLEIERQIWRADRRGYVSLGSLDTRKNQRLIVEAFIRLWDTGHAIPLTLIGSAFVGHKLEWLDVACRYPMFRWLNSASDAEVAAAMGNTRASIYVSEAEGYGLPPVESLAVGVPVIASASCPSVAMLQPAGTVQLKHVSSDEIAAAVSSLEDDQVATKLWEAAAGTRFGTWREFAEATAAWLDCDRMAGSQVTPRTANDPDADQTRPVGAPTADISIEGPLKRGRAQHPERLSTEIQMNFADMYTWWNRAALDNPMTAILSNEQKWDPVAFFETGRVWLGEHRSFAAAANTALAGKCAMDFGCGVGRMTEALAEHYESVVGVDISDEMVRLAYDHRRRTSVEFVQVTEPPLPFEDHVFECVYSAIVVQHIPFPYNLQYVREFFRISSDVVLFDAPSHFHQGVRPGPGIFMLDLRYVLTCASEAGFELIGLRDFPATDARHYQYLFRRSG